MSDSKRGQFASFYSDLLENSATDNAKTLRVFERKVSDGVYYTAHGDNALYVADEFFKTRDVVSYARDGDTQLEGVNIRPQKLSTILKHILLEKKDGFERVELYHKTADNPRTFVLSKTASPGNFSAFDDILYSSDGMTESAVVVALKVSTTAEGQRLVGCAFVDATLQTIQLCEFVDNDRFVNFESVVVQRGAKECLAGFDKVSVTPADQRKINNILERCGIPLTERKSSDFKGADIEQDLARLVGSLEQHLAALEKKNATGALACVIKYLELLRDETAHGKFKLSLFDLAQYMKLDKSAVEALNLFPTAKDSDKNQSLFGLLDKCKTSAGSRLLMQWIKQPLLDEKIIKRRLDLVEIFVNDAGVRCALQEDHLRRIPDLDRMSKKFQKGTAGLQTIVDFYKFSVCLPSLVNCLKDYSGEFDELLQSEFIDVLDRLVQDLSQFEQMVEQSIDLDAIENHEYLINPAFDPRLEDLKRQKDRLSRMIDDHLEETSDALGLESGKVKLSNAPNLGDHFRVSRKDERVLRGNSKFTTLDTRKDGVRFTTIKMKKYSREMAALRQDYEEVQKEIVQKAVEISTTYCSVMEELNEVLSELDVVVAFAHVAMGAPEPYCRPEFAPLGSNIIEVKGARHPCMEVLEGVSFIPNDCRMVRGESNVQVITGPNMGGKSTYIRQMGVICLMAQIGCWVPCDQAKISMVDCILARVGAGDSQLKGVSTFMKEMLEASHILKQATANSLVIIDELGRGTSTYDGFGLAWAIAEYLATHLHAFSLFATHFHELTALANSCPSVVNQHVTAHTSDNNITMLYKVNDGPCDRSFGIHVSELANFPAEVVAAAKRKAAELENFGNTAGLDLLTHDGHMGEGANSSKRAKLNDDQTSMVSKFLGEFAKLPLDSMNDEEIKSKLDEIRSQVMYEG